jgi:hypothetical protein
MLHELPMAMPIPATIAPPMVTTINEERNGTFRK